MADSSVEISLVANAKRLIAGFKKGEAASKRFTDALKRHQNSIRKVAMVATAAFAGQVYALKKLAAAAGVQEKAENDLRVALKIQGETRESVVKGLFAQASALQKLTTFGDEEILAAQALLVTYGVTADQLEATTKATLDFAAATGRDLTTAALTTGKAVGAGFTAELSRYGIVLDTATIPKTELATAVLGKMNAMFGGRAAAEANTYVGRMKQLSNAIGDLKETIGASVLPMLTNMAEKLLPVVEKTGAWITANKKLVGILIGVGIGGTGLTAALATLGLILPTLAVGFSALLGPVGLVASALGILAAVTATLYLRQKGLPETYEALESAIEGANSQIGFWDQQLKDGLVTHGQWERETEILTAHVEDLTDGLRILSDAIPAQDAHVQAYMATLKGAGEAFAGLNVKSDEFADGVAPRQQTAWLGVMGAFVKATEARKAFTDEVKRGTDAMDADLAAAEAYANRINTIAAGVVSAWSSATSQMIDARQNFVESMLKGAAAGFIAMFRMAIEMGIAELMAKKAAEVGKSIIEAPGTFGASLLKIAPITAAAAAAIAGLKALEGSFSKGMPSFAMGGVVRETGPALVHQGEVIVNPRMPGKGQEALAGAGAINVNFYGPVYDGVQEVERGVARAIRGAR